MRAQADLIGNRQCPGHRGRLVRADAGAGAVVFAVIGDHEIAEAADRLEQQRSAHVVGIAVVIIPATEGQVVGIPVAAVDLPRDAQRELVGDQRNVECAFVGIPAIAAARDLEVAVQIIRGPLRGHEHRTGRGIAAEQRALRALSTCTDAMS